MIREDNLHIEEVHMRNSFVNVLPPSGHKRLQLLLPSQCQFSTCALTEQGDDTWVLFRINHHLLTPFACGVVDPLAMASGILWASLCAFLAANGALQGAFVQAGFR